MCYESKAGMACSHPRTGEAVGFGLSLAADLQLTACELPGFLFLTSKPPGPTGKALEWDVSSVRF